MIYGLILASGVGSRMGNSQMPKQFLNIGSRPILIHTLEKFYINDSICKLVIAVSEEWYDHTVDLVKYYFPFNNKIEIILGGNDRNETILNGCKYIKETHKITDLDIIITHDAVRPFVSSKIINSNILAAKNHAVVNTVVAALDTIVCANSDFLISNIPPRKEMFIGQTPQTFRINDFIKLYAQLTSEEKGILTDACKIFHIKGYDVFCVEGDYANFKITNKYDMTVANLLVNMEKNL